MNLKGFCIWFNIKRSFALNISHFVQELNSLWKLSKTTYYEGLLRLMRERPA